MKAGSQWSPVRISPLESDTTLHVMIFVPCYENAMVDDNPFGSPLPQLKLTDDAGNPFAMVVIPIDDKLAIGGEMK